MSWFTRRQTRQRLEKLESNMMRISHEMNSADPARKIAATFEGGAMLTIARNIIKGLGENRQAPDSQEFWNDPKFVRSFDSFVNTAKEFEAQVMQNPLLFPKTNKGVARSKNRGDDLVDEPEAKPKKKRSSKKRKLKVSTANKTKRTTDESSAA